MAEFVISAAIPKFQGANVRDLAKDDLVYMPGLHRWPQALGRAPHDELRRRANLTKRRHGRRRNRRRLYRYKFSLRLFRSRAAGGRRFTTRRPPLHDFAPRAVGPSEIRQPSVIYVNPWMYSETQYGHTLLLDGFEPDASAERLKRLHFSKTASESAPYDEALAPTAHHALSEHTACRSN